MELQTKRYVEFEVFMNNLEKNKQALITKLADSQDKITMLRREKQVLDTLIPVGLGRENLVRKQQKEQPEDTLLIAEVARLTENNSQSENRLALVSLGLDAAKIEYQELLSQNSLWNPQPLADAAVQEMGSEIQRLYSEFIDAINAACAARSEYLKLVKKVSIIAYDGNRATYAGQKAQSYGTLKLTPSGDFSTGTKQFLVSELDVKSA